MVDNYNEAYCQGIADGIAWSEKKRR